MDATLALALAVVLWLCAAPAQAQQVRLAASVDCLVNAGCGLGLKSAYGLDVAPAFVPLTVADSGVSALDDGLAEAAVAFSSNLLVSRPDIVILRDERDMIYPDRAVPVVAAACCAATAAVRATCAAASMQPRPLLALIPGPGTGPAAS